MDQGPPEAGETGARAVRPVRVAVVDSGVHASHPHVGGVAGGLTVVPDAANRGDYIDRVGHGTAVAAAIRERAPGAELFIVKVFDRALSASIDTLIAGIDAAWRQRADVINLSLGTANPAHAPALRAAADRAAAAGSLIVSAGRHEDVRYLPGSLDGVVAVELDWTCPRLSVEVVADADRGPVCRASGYPRPAPGISPERNLKGLSFAVANVTGLLARTLAGGCRPTADAAVSALLDESDRSRR